MARRAEKFSPKEMATVVIIVAALMGIGGFFLARQFGGSAESVARVRCNVLRQAIESYQIEHQGSVPESVEELTAGSYLKKDFVNRDPWGKPYQFEKLASGEISVWSDGPPGGQRIGNNLK